MKINQRPVAIPIGLGYLWGVMKLYNITSATKAFTQGAPSWDALLATLETFSEGALRDLFGPPYATGKTWYLKAAPIKGGAEKQIEVRIDGLGWTEATLVKP
jgi:hypothetical protein